ncbi:hypothetical protein D3C75_1292780 [compost metagenome]
MRFQRVDDEQAFAGQPINQQSLDDVNAVSLQFEAVQWDQGLPHARGTGRERYVVALVERAPGH